MNSSGSVSGSVSVTVSVPVAVVPRRARRRRSSLTLYGSPLLSTQGPTTPGQTTQPEAPSADHALAGRALEADADRDADALLAVIRRVQAEARRDATLSSIVPALDLDRVVASTVSDLWRNSPIKTFVPVLALRLTREAILAETRDESMLERGIPPRSPHSTR